MDDDDRTDLISRLFALLTAQLEDSVTLALEGQGRDLLLTQHERAEELEIKVRDAHTIVEALVMLTQSGKSPAGEPPPSAS